MRLKSIVLGFLLALGISGSANALIIPLGTLSPVHLEPFNFQFNGDSTDTFTFTVDDSFSFTSTVTAFGSEITDLGIELSTGGNVDDEAGVMIAPSVFQVTMLHDLLPAGDYSFSYGVDTSGSSSLNVVSGSFTVGLPVAAVPEPQEYAMLLAGLALVSFASRKKAS